MAEAVGIEELELLADWRDRLLPLLPLTTAVIQQALFIDVSVFLNALVSKMLQNQEQ